ncbi:MAG: transcriptional regulator NrdR [Clostridia bacterium]
MKCHYCNSEETRVLESRAVEDGYAIRRRRECMDCCKRFTTYEKVESLPVMIVKKSGKRELFDSKKILRGLIKSVEKRSIPVDVLEKMTDEIEKEVLNAMEMEITSEVIGNMVMERLKNVDAVAYVRFASVYREFRDVETFISEIEELLKHGNYKD